MPKLLLKVIAALLGIGVLFYLLGRKLSVWEIDAVQQQKKEKEGVPASQPAGNTSTSTPAPEKSSGSLQKIKGIGRVIEDKLNRIGYYRLEQIANLTAEEKDRIEKELSFPGRIERDQWVEQAKALLG